MVNTVGWFDFAVDGYFAKELGGASFPEDGPSLQLLSAFAVFAVGYLMRPVGGLLLGPIGDLVGRRALLLVSVAVMAACSLGIALLPPASQWGPSSAVLLVLLRLLQGLSVGGEFTGSVVALVETAPRQRRGLTASFASAGAVLGFVGGSLAAALIHLWLDPPAVQQWGWRVPFVLGAALGIWALSLRTHLEETRPGQAPIGLAAHLAELRGQWPAMGRLMAAVALSAVSFYAATVFAVQEASTRLPALAASFNAITTLNQAIGVGLILLGGHLADRGAPVALARRLSLLLAVGVLPGMLLIAAGPPLAFAVGQLIVLVPLMLYLGVYPSLLPGLFPAAQRCSAFSLSYSLVTAVLGGTLPLIATWLEVSLALPQGPALYGLIWAVPTLLAYRQLERHLLLDWQG
ncbi:MFS transporter [Cyanobium sp. BA20m-p-22]|uniref:MFS transporter n=1 Tax=Cyanobium sp. BA20m-p-22 TaxID=2823704 RepID=UPI0020CF0F30|nr:MFS transporter [Cyanobium sp. BA20m-p-22]